MDVFDDANWDLLDYTNFNLDDATSADFSWVNSHHGSSIDLDFSGTNTVSVGNECLDILDVPRQSSSIDIDFSCTNTVPAGDECLGVVDAPQKRGFRDPLIRKTTKACRERLRREKMNDSFMDLSVALEPGRAAKIDKLAILNDAIKVLNQLRTEAYEYKEENEKLHEEIETLKAEKNELRVEKHVLRAEKEKVVQQLKAMTISTPGFASAPHPAAAYHAAANKMAFCPSYGLYPTWHYLPPSARDTSRDHELRPPAA